MLVYCEEQPAEIIVSSNSSSSSSSVETHRCTQLIDCAKALHVIVVHTVWVIANSHQVRCIRDDLHMLVLLLLQRQALPVVDQYAAMWPLLVSAAAKHDPVEG
jgi:hypothetical protein